MLASHRGMFSTSTEKSPLFGLPGVAHAQSFRRRTDSQTFGGLRALRTLPPHPAVPGYGPLLTVTPAETPRPLGTRRPPESRVSVLVVSVLQYVGVSGVAPPMFLKGFCIFDFQK